MQACCRGRIPCTYCRKKFTPERLEVHLRFFCGPNAKKSAALAKQQKKRPRGDGKGKAADDKDADSAADSTQEEEQPKKNKAPKQALAKKKGKEAGGKGKDKAGGKGKGKGKAPAGKGKAAKVTSFWAASMREWSKEFAVACVSDACPVRSQISKKKAH